MDLGHQTFPRPVPASRPIDTLLLWQQHTPSKNTLLHQPNRLACGGARLSGNRSAARVKHYYSVLHHLVKQAVEVQATDRSVAVCHQGQRAASHPRS